MKKLIYTAFVICGMLTASCSDLLNLESKTDVTNNYLFTTPEGLNTAVTGLYSLARELPGGADNNESNLYIVTMCDFNTDIAILRAGVSTSIGRLNTSFTPSTGDVNKFWKHHYGIIGKANEINFYNCLIDIINNPQIINEKKNNSQNWSLINNYYSWDSISAKTLKTYKKTINN